MISWTYLPIAAAVRSRVFFCVCCHDPVCRRRGGGIGFHWRRIDGGSAARQNSTPDRRPPTPEVIARAPSVSPSAHPAQLLQRRFGNEGTGRLLARASIFAVSVRKEGSIVPSRADQSGSEAPATLISAAAAQSPARLPEPVAGAGAQPQEGSLSRASGAGRPTPSPSPATHQLTTLTGQIKFQVTHSSTRATATLVFEGVECTWKGVLLESYHGFMNCADKTRLPLRPWTK